MPVGDFTLVATVTGATLPVATVMLAVPLATALTTPALLTGATVGLDEVKVTPVARTAVELSEY
jgi:hypothetical protein